MRKKVSSIVAQERCRDGTVITYFSDRTLQLEQKEKVIVLKRTSVQCLRRLLANPDVKALLAL